jgi:hypothetical protein
VFAFSGLAHFSQHRQSVPRLTCTILIGYLSLERFLANPNHAQKLRREALPCSPLVDAMERQSEAERHPQGQSAGQHDQKGDGHQHIL